MDEMFFLIFIGFFMDMDLERRRMGLRIAELRMAVKWTDEGGVHRVGMSQKELADRCGLTQSHVSRIEAGRYSLRLDTIQHIADALGGYVDIVQSK